MDNDKTIQKKVAKNISILRGLSCLTQEQLAEELKISISQYSNYELGKRAIPIDTLIIISSFFDLSLDIMTKGDLSKVRVDKIRDIGQNRVLFPIEIKNDEGTTEKIVFVTDDNCGDYQEDVKKYRKNIFT